MNGVKGKFLKKLKSIKPIGYLNQDRILQAFAPDAYSDFFSRNDSLKVGIKKSEAKIDSVQQNLDGVGELRRDVDDEETESNYENDDKENIEPLGKSKGFAECRNGFRKTKCLEQESRQSNALRARNGSDSRQECCTALTPLSEIDISSFRRPDMDSGSLFDPDLLAVFHQVVREHMKLREAEIKCRINDENAGKKEEGKEEEEEEKGEEEEEEAQENTLFGFQENCPPGGSDAVVFYTTTLRGIRKTFEDCNSIRFLLETFRVKFYERDISMHREFKEELWRVLDTKALPPKLFIRGRYIGGAEEVLGLHEQGKLRPLFSGVPIDHFAGSPCEMCGGIRFVLCFNCNGSHKVIAENDDEETRKCPECNENGLILCPYCC